MPRAAARVGNPRSTEARSSSRERRKVILFFEVASVSRERRGIFASTSCSAMHHTIYRTGALLQSTLERCRVSVRTGTRRREKDSMARKRVNSRTESAGCSLEKRCVYHGPIFPATRLTQIGARARSLELLLSLRDESHPRLFPRQPTISNDRQ